MIYGHLDIPATYACLVAHPTWRQAFDWLRQLPDRPALGIHPIDGEELYANIMEYETLPREQCRFESHAKYIDLQFTISGLELIDCAWSSHLAPDGGFSAEKDLQFYLPADPLTTLFMGPRHFAIFFPCDAHRPKVRTAGPASAFKLVVKINLSKITGA